MRCWTWRRNHNSKWTWVKLLSPTLHTSRAVASANRCFPHRTQETKLIPIGQPTQVCRTTNSPLCFDIRWENVGGRSEASYYVPCDLCCSALSLGIVVQNAVLQRCFTGVVNSSSHNSAVGVKLSCLCFALVFLLLFRVSSNWARGGKHDCSANVFVLSRIVTPVSDREAPRLDCLQRSEGDKKVSETSETVET